MKISWSTIKWWLSQSDDARKYLLMDGIKIENALIGLKNFLTDISYENNVPLIWGNGVSFDNVHVANAYKICDIALPWDYKQDRCYRTVKSFFPDIEIPKKGVKHNSLDDAINQANHLLTINEKFISAN